MKKFYSYHHLKWISTLLIFLFSIPSLLGQSFEENFNDNNIVRSSNFTKKLADVQFDFIFIGGDRDGGVFDWSGRNGEADSPSVDLYSSNVDDKTERVIIKRQDGNPFIFTSIFINNETGNPVTVQGYHGANAVGSPQIVGWAESATLNFSNIIVTEVSITSNDFFGTFIDAFRGEIITNTPPTASSFTAANGPYENLTYAFSTSMFGYSDLDGDPLGHILIESLPASGILFLDLNDNNKNDSGEEVSVNDQISKADLDAGNLQYIQNGSTNTSFQFEVNDGTVNSSGNYVANLNVNPVPTVTLSLTPTSKNEAITTTTEIKATLSNIFGAPVTVNLGFSGTAIGSGLDYSVSGTSITINPGNTTGVINLTNLPDAVYEGNETIIIDINSVTNGVENGVQQQTFTIIDDDTAPTVSLEVVDYWNPITDESGGYAFVRGKIDAVVGTSITIPLSFSGTAVEGTDYETTGATITLSPGQTMDSIRVKSLLDGIEEGDETIIIDMGAPTNGIKGSPDQVTLTIKDEDLAAPKDYTVEINQDPITPSTSSNVSFSFTNAEIGTTYNYQFVSSAGGSSVSGSGTIISANQTISNIDLSGMNDGTITLSVDLTDIYNNTGATVEVTASKLASDPPFMTGLPTDIAVVEGVASNIDLSGTTFGDPDAAVDDILDISYLALGGTLSFNPGVGITVNQTVPGSWKTSGTISDLNTYLSDPASIKFTSNPGVIGDNAGSIDLTGSDGLVGGALGTINIDVEPQISISVDDVSVAEGDAGTTNLQFTVSLNAPAPAGGATIDYATSNGSAIAGSDYTDVSGTLNFAIGETSKTIDVPVSGDAEVEASEIFTLTLSNPSGTGIALGDATGTGLIFNDDFKKATRIYWANREKIQSAKLDGSDIQTIATGPYFGIRIDHENQKLYFNELSGDILKADLDGSNVETIVSGAEATGIALDLVNNKIYWTQYNNHKIARASLDGSNVEDVVASADAPTGVWVDNYTNKIYWGGYYSDKFFRSNLDGTNIEVVVSKTGFPWSVQADALNGKLYFTDNDELGRADMDGSNIEILYNYGTSLGMDLDLEAGKVYHGAAGIRMANLDGTSKAEIIPYASSGGVYGIALSTEEIEVSVSVDDASIAEGNSGNTTLTFTVSLDNPASAGGATVDYATSNGSAIAGSDYTATNGTLSFAEGETSKTVDISISGDETVELDETLTLTLSNPTGTGIVIGDFTGEGTILNDDAAAVTIAEVSGNEDDGAITLTATLDNAVQGGFTIDVSTADGTATVADNDYTAVTGQTLTFAGTSGEIQTFTVTPTLDLVQEVDETLTVSQSNLAGTSLAVDISDIATVTILNDDFPPSGYTVAWDDNLINSTEALNTFFTVSNAEIGTTLFYSISSSGDGNTATVTGSKAVVDLNEVVNVDVSSLVDGLLTVEVYLQDAGGNNGNNTSDNSAVLDKNPPSAPSAPDLTPASDTGLSDSDNITADNTPTFTGFTEPNATVTFYANATELGSATSDGAGHWTFTPASAIADGTYDITAIVTDLAGNTGIASSALSVTIDTMSPDSPIKGGITDDTGVSNTDNITSDNTLIFGGTSEPGSMVSLSIGGIGNIGTTTADGAGNWTFGYTGTVLLDGTYELTAYATDLAGNIGAVSGVLDIVIDTQAPAIPSVPDLAPASDSGVSDSDNITNDLTPTIQGTAEPNSTLVLFNIDLGEVEIPVDASGNWSYTYGPALGTGLTFFVAKAVDLAGNESANSNRLDIVIDDTAPLAAVEDPIIQLDANGNASLVPSDILLNVSDNITSESNITLALSQDSFDCSDVGTGSIILNATDEAGNTSSWESYTTVRDEVAPTIVAKSAITLNVDAFGTVDLTAAMIDEGSTDACGIQSQVLSQTLFDRTDEGANNITYTVSDVNGNDAQVNVAVTIVVVPKVLDIAVDAGQSKVYGEGDPVYTFTATGFEGGDDISILTGALSRVPGEDAGTYVINLGTLDAGPNYKVNFTSADFEITEAALTVTADDQSKVYGETDPALTVSYSGFVNGDDATALGGTLDVSRTAGEDVGNYTITASGYTSGNYTISYEDGSFDITQAALTVTADDQSKVYGAADPSLTVSYSGFVNGDDETALGGTLDVSRAAGEDVGNYTITASGYTSGNYTISYMDGSFEITQAALTVTADDQSKVYGTADPALTVSYSGFMNGDDETALGGTFNVIRAAGEDVGNYAITASGYTSGNYTISYVDGNFAITPAALTVTADDKSKVYGDAEPSLTVSYSGFVNGDDETALGGTLDVSRAAGEDVGTYAITASGYTSSNYTISYVDGSFEITQAALTVTADDQSKVYGTADPALTISYAGFVNGDDETALGGTLDVSRAAGEDVGTYAITASGYTSSNYTISYVDGSFEITQAALTVTADDQSKVYGTADPALTVSYAGFVNGDDETALGGTLGVSRVSGEDVGTYAITASGYTSSNYTISYMDGSFEITQAALTITADDQSKVYGTADPGLTVSYSGFVNGDDATALGGTLDISRATGEDVGNYTITASGYTSSNYTISYVDGSFEITKAALTLTADDKSKVYGDTEPSLTVSYSGFVNGDDETALGGALDVSRAAGEDVGTYAITASGYTSSNYTISYVDGSFEITQAALTITADDQSKVYGTADPALTVSYSGFVNGDDATALGGTLDISRAAGEDVGNYTITASGYTSSNYTISYVDGSFEITKAALTVTADNQSKVYGDTDPSLTVSYIGFVNGDDETALGGTLDVSRTAGEDVGTYAITASGYTSGNYTISYIDGSFAITPAALTVTADDKSKVYGTADPLLSYTASGFVNGDDESILSGSLSRAVGEDIGVYAIELGSLSAGENYNIVYQPATLSIQGRKIEEVYEPAAVTVDWGVAVDGIMLPETVLVRTEQDELINLNVNWNTSPIDTRARGAYRITGLLELPGTVLAEDVPVPFMFVHVNAKPAPADLVLDNNSFEAQNGPVAIGSITVVDPVDNQHVLELVSGSADNGHFSLSGNSLYWDSQEALAGRTSFDIMVQVTDADGNIVQKSFTITRLRKSLDDIEVYNTFSPNEDGRNDTWGVEELRYQTGVRIMVFERSGNRIFYTENPELRWDGTYKGKEMAPGTYFWVIESSEDDKVRRGILNLLR
ncbi:MBG domain-containing protein [Echinicola salinicaeni]|uniref:MBG domain-containing protein n=1 Tax=Echinicola salinicaeni TaxID=2762757 RepID=UPI001647B16B|nr:MBG domain-containing protein [Echinicola salinicaeni]